MEAYFPQNSTYGPHRMASSENGSCVFFSTDQIILIDLKPYLEHCQHPAEARTSDSSSWRTPNPPVQDSLPPLIPRSEKNLTDGKFQSIDLSPLGDQVVTGDIDGEVSLFSINNDNCDRLFTKLKKHDGHKVGVHGKEKLSRVTAISWSKADPNIVVSGDGDGKIVAWTLSSNTVANYKPTSSIEITVLRTHPSKRGIIGVGYIKGLIMIFDVCDKFSILMKTKASDTDIQDFSWSPAPEILEISSEELSKTEEDLHFVVGCKDQAVTVWSLKTSKVIAHINHYEKSSKFKDRKYPPKGHRQICFWTSNRIIQTNSLCGEVLEWNMENMEKSGDRYTAYRSNARVVCDGLKQVNGALMVGPSLLLVQSSQKTIVGVHSKTRDVLFNLPMFHYLNCISPNSSLVAFGGSDIRLWKTDSQNVNFDVQTLWVQSATVVIDIAWHPTKEGLLAFSTDNGQVGFLEALSQNKSAKFSSFRHKKEVYKVLWGPPVSTDSINSEGNFTVYSVGDFKLVQHPFRDNNAVVMNPLLNNQKERELKISQALFHPVDFGKLIVGYFDGTIEVFSFPKLDRLCIMKSIVKMITTIAWHPEYTGISSDPSPLRHYIAVASLHKNANIFDLSEVLAEKEDGRPSTPVVVAKTALIGHEGTIFALCWSPFEDGKVLTVSRDYTAMVWDAITGTALSVFFRHPRRLTTCAWHPSNSDFVLTGSEDGTMFCWKVSSYPFSDSKESHFEKKRRKKPNAGHRREGRDGEDGLTILEKALDEKKTEILSNDQKDGLTPERQGDERVAPKKSKKNVSIFGPAKGAMSRSDGLFEDIESLAQLVAGYEEKQDLLGALNKTSTGVFFTDKKGAEIALAQEINRLQQTQAGLEVDVLKCFSGDYGQIVREAIQTSTITDWHVSLAAATGYGLYKEVCIAFGNQLAGNGYPVRGSSYLIMVGQVKEAIDLLMKHAEFPSAIALARKRLPEGSPVFKEIYEAWAMSTDNGTLESVRPNLALGNLNLAAQTLARSDKPEVLKLATSVSKLSGNSDLTRVTSIHCARTCAARGEWKILKELSEEVDVPEVQDIRAKYLEMELDKLQIGKEKLESLNIKEETGDTDLDEAESRRS